jgi:indolepyruvate ferredoxin oxidoreductase
MHSLYMTTIDDRRLLGIDPSDRWSARADIVHLSGVQAVTRSIIDTLRADGLRGRRTAALVSGYQGSPLAGFDRELQQALSGSLGVEIVHRPAVNEELGVTAVMGSQLVSTMGTGRLDGVLGVWYGKAPGLDRSTDALRHANFAGASAYGGALALVGDDPDAKSSTLPSASEAILADLAIPTLFPRTLHEILELGRHAVALSRWSGAWVAMKMVTSVADAEGTVDLSELGVPILPEGYLAPQVSGDLLTPSTITREALVLTDRINAAARYGDANGLNRIVSSPIRARVALVAAGTVFAELKKALELLGLDLQTLQDLGIRLAEIRMPFPLGQEFARALASGVEQVIVVEERREVIESQLLSLMARTAEAPAVIGKLDEVGIPFIPRHGSLNASSIARLIAPRLEALFGTRIAPVPVRRERTRIPVAAARVPWFCPGCPHSASTVVPEGTLVSVGIGCHSIVNFMPESRVGRSIGLTQMGGEGAQWIGMSPFVADRHIVANLGDGTFFHSGQLAVRAAVAAGVSMTYKILWNGASAMTGGQHVVGSLESPLDLARLLLLEGVEEVVITTDDPSRYRKLAVPKQVSVKSRDEIVPAQVRLASIDGVTVLIHDQICATELRRARKRGLAPKPASKIIINERVCEGCGDCQVKSNCLALQTIDTTFGPKTRIDEDSCNVDASCLKGDCPAFGLIDQRPPRRHRAASRPAMMTEDPDLPIAPVAALDRPMTIRIAGIGGTGVVTAAHLLAWAAMIDGIDVWGLDQTGLSQKAGPVVSDLRIGPGAWARSNVLGDDDVDVLLATDLMAAVPPSVLSGIRLGHTAVIGSTAASLTGPMVLGLQERHVPDPELQELLALQTGPGRAVFVDAEALAIQGGAASSMANVVLLGIASQRGVLPVSAGALEAAIERNDVSVTANIAAFRIGRSWEAGALRGVVDTSHRDVQPDKVALLFSNAKIPSRHLNRMSTLANDLIDYQSRDLARRFAQLVIDAWRAEQHAGGDGDFTAAVAAGYHRLLAYKDEYEVARLLLDHPSSTGRVTWLLHPPALRARGLTRKLRFGPWSRPAMKGLRAARRIRGTAVDPFGRTPLRRTERALPTEYAEAVRALLPTLNSGNLELAKEVALLPMNVRGYESVKQQSITTYRSELAGRMGSWSSTDHLSQGH